MKLTRAAEYAIRCVLYLAKQPLGRVVSRKEISQAMDIPSPFLGKIAQSLAKAGIMTVRQGAQGGYVLALPPKDITLLMLVETMDGEIALNECLTRPQQCGRSNWCAVHASWGLVRDNFREALRGVNFARLASDDLCPDNVSSGPHSSTPTRLG